MAVAVESSIRPQEVSTADMDTKVPHFKTARTLNLGRDGNLHRGRPRLLLRSHTLGGVVDKLVRDNVAGFQVGGEVTYALNATPKDAPAGEITATTTDRRHINVPFNNKTDLVVFTTSKHLKSFRRT